MSCNRVHSKIKSEFRLLWTQRVFSILKGHVKILRNPIGCPIGSLWTKHFHFRDRPTQQHIVVLSQQNMRNSSSGFHQDQVFASRNNTSPVFRSYEHWRPWAISTWQREIFWLKSRPQIFSSINLNDLRTRVSSSKGTFLLWWEASSSYVFISEVGPIKFPSSGFSRVQAGRLGCTNHGLV